MSKSCDCFTVKLGSGCPLTGICFWNPEKKVKYSCHGCVSHVFCEIRSHCWILKQLTSKPFLNVYEWKLPSGLRRHHTQTFFDLSPDTTYIYSFCYSFKPPSILPEKDGEGAGGVLFGETTAGFSLFEISLHKCDDMQDRDIIEFTAQTEYFQGKIILLVDTCRPMLIKSPYPEKCAQ